MSSSAISNSPAGCAAPGKCAAAARRSARSPCGSMSGAATLAQAGNGDPRHAPRHLAGARPFFPILQQPRLAGGLSRSPMNFLHAINPLYSLSGFVVGVLVGMTGVGGGSLMTPLLILVFGIHPSTAVGTDLLYAAATKTVGTAVHGANRTVQW